MAISITNAPLLASAIIDMRGITLASISVATGVKVANLSMWLRGKEQVVAEKRVVGVLEYLGVIGGALANDRVHEWSINGSIVALKCVLDILLDGEQKKLSVVYVDTEQGYPQIRYLGVFTEKGMSQVRLVVSAGLAESPIISASTLGLGQEFMLPFSLKSMPFDRVVDVQDFLSQGVKFSVDTNQKNAVDIIEQALSNTSPQAGIADKNNILDSGFSNLQSQLERVFKNGVSPNEIAKLIASQFPVDSK